MPKPRARSLVVAASIALLLVPVLHADVKTRQKVQLKFEGMLGRMMSLAGGAASGNGETSTLAVKGARMAQLGDRTGRIVDLSEERVYELDMRRKDYRVVTFEEMREQLRKARADAEQAAKDMPQEERDELAQEGKEVEITIDVQETGKTRSIAGHTAKQVIVTLTAHEKGKTLEEGGGFVVTNDTWIAPRIPEMNEIADFAMKFAKAVYGDEMMAATQQMGQALAMYPSLQKVMSQMDDRMRALDGTALLTVSKIETVKSKAAMESTPPPPTGGGLGGALARRLGAGRKPEQRSLLATITTETQSIDASASDADVALPTGFKQR
jgi:hypothetical protein